MMKLTNARVIIESFHFLMQKSFHPLNQFRGTAGGHGESRGQIKQLKHNMLVKKNFPVVQMIRFQDDDVIMCYYGIRDGLTTKKWSGGAIWLVITIRDY